MVIKKYFVIILKLLRLPQNYVFNNGTILMKMRSAERHPSLSLRSPCSAINLFFDGFCYVSREDSPFKRKEMSLQYHTTSSFIKDEGFTIHTKHRAFIFLEQMTAFVAGNCWSQICGRIWLLTGLSKIILPVNQYVAIVWRQLRLQQNYTFQ